MLGYLILVIIQIAAAWFGGKFIDANLPPIIDGTIKPFAMGAIYGAIAWATGLVGSQVLKGVSTPGTSTAASAIIGGLLGAGLLLVLPLLGISLPRGINKEFIPLAGAILGYLARR